MYIGQDVGIFIVDNDNNRKIELSGNVQEVNLSTNVDDEVYTSFVAKSYKNPEFSSWEFEANFSGTGIGTGRIFQCPYCLETYFEKTTRCKNCLEYLPT